MSPEFSRRVALDTIGSSVRTVSIEANADERTALARRFDLVALDRLEASAEIAARGDSVEAKGRLTARVVQTCVVTDAPVESTIEEAFTLRFVEPAAFAAIAEEVELSDADCDVIETDDSAIDLGEAVAQSLGLALDPFPRAAAVADGTERVWKAGTEASPFAALAALTPKAGTPA